jgi:hypothetical protein
MALSIFKDNNQTFQLMQNQWATQINPVIANPVNNVSVLQNVSLINGVNVINHKLGQQQQGWFLVDQQGIASVYRSAPFNKITLQLTSSAAVTVSIGVF